MEINNSNSRLWSCIMKMQFTSGLKTWKKEEMFWQWHSIVSCACNFCVLLFRTEFKQNLMVINDVHVPFETVAFCVCLLTVHPFAIVIMIIGKRYNDECIELWNNLWICTFMHHTTCCAIFASSIQFIQFRFLNGLMACILQSAFKCIQKSISISRNIWHCLSFFIH